MATCAPKSMYASSLKQVSAASLPPLRRPFAKEQEDMVIRSASCVAFITNGASSPRSKLMVGVDSAAPRDPNVKLVLRHQELLDVIPQLVCPPKERAFALFTTSQDPGLVWMKMGSEVTSASLNMRARRKKPMARITRAMSLSTRKANRECAPFITRSARW